MISAGGLSSNFSRKLRDIFHAPTCWCWVLVIVVIQTIVSLAGGANRQSVWFQTFGLSEKGLLHGKIWQLFTYGFLHGGGWHVGLNALFVLSIGSRIEHMLGRKVLMQTIVLGILAGGISHVILSPAGGILVGLSGGCMSLLLLLTTISPQSRMMPIPVSGKNLGLGILVAALILALINPALGLPWFSPMGKFLAAQGMGRWFQMGHACHFGGGIAGWLSGRWLLRPRVSLSRLRHDRVRRENP